MINVEDLNPPPRGLGWFYRRFGHMWGWEDVPVRLNRALRMAHNASTERIDRGMLSRYPDVLAIALASQNLREVK